MAGHMVNPSSKFEDPMAIRSWVELSRIPLTVRLQPLHMRRISWSVCRSKCFPQGIICTPLRGWITPKDLTTPQRLWPLGGVGTVFELLTMISPKVIYRDTYVTDYVIQLLAGCLLIPVLMSSHTGNRFHIKPNHLSHNTTRLPVQYACKHWAVKIAGGGLLICREGIIRHHSSVSNVHRLTTVSSCFVYVRHLQTCNINFTCPIFQKAENATDEL